ncbi:hypothetical protein [Prosthecobacter sp.]|uniref:hypothetical protein n=1 Tax=Prosthecobacter sp. TaxID=1965333 RepID=UPI0024872725|nr:hypothetical protein [Prosthecobacter sp.]MDI1311260.1 hypothetical protein [Prosthecobacter sp.]
MSSTRLRLTLLLASLLTVAALPSCTEGNLGRLRNVRAGAIGIGPTGDLPGDRALPHFKPESAEELRVNLAIRRGVERALDDSRAFSYTPFTQMKQVPPHLNIANQRSEVKKFAAVNHLSAVIRVWVTADLKQQGVTVGFVTHARSGKTIATGLARAPGPVPPMENPTARASMRTWEKTAYEATKNALAKVRG